MIGCRLYCNANVFQQRKYYAFVKACRDAGITVPIIPGLKPIYTKKQLTVLPKTFHIDLPTDLSNEVLKCKTDEEVEKVGAEWLLYQSKELKNLVCRYCIIIHWGDPTFNCWSGKRACLKYRKLFRDIFYLSSS